MTYVDKRLCWIEIWQKCMELKPALLNQAVKRNTDRFPIDFMFQLTDEKRKSKTVIQINMGIMRAFVAVRYC